ncbi:hypothetical protein N9O40_00875 [Planktomarina sp.]|nr:hypothetical protein [Planktomarina sp.]
MTIMRSLGRRVIKYLVYDEMGKVVVITRNKKIALNHLPSNNAA